MNNNSKKIIYNNETNTLMNLPRTFFGNHIYSIDKKKIICVDLPIILDVFNINKIDTYTVNIKSQSNPILIDYYENMSIIRLFYNKHIDRWHMATVNSINAMDNIYRTNRNFNMKYNTKSFFDLFTKYVYKQFHYSKLDKNKNYFYGIVIPEIFMTNFVTKGCVFPILEYDLILKKYTSPDLKNIKLPHQEIIYTLKITTEHTYILKTKYTEEYIERRNIIGNIPNIHYIFIKQLKNYKRFVELFPFWKAGFDKLIFDLNRKIKYIMNMYKILCIQRSKKINYRRTGIINFLINSSKMSSQLKKKKLDKHNIEYLVDTVTNQNPICMIFVNEIHNKWLSNKIKIKFNNVKSIILSMDSSTICALLPQTSLIFTY